MLIPVLILLLILVSTAVWRRQHKQRDDCRHDCMRGIPRVVYQTHQSQDRVRRDPTLAMATATWTRVPGYQYAFHDDDQARKLVHDVLSPRYARTYDQVSLPVMKSDIWRYAVIYAHGGIYADCDTVLTDPRGLDALTQSSAQLVVVPEYDYNQYCQWVFAAPPRSPIMLSILQVVLERLEKHHLTKDVLTEQSVLDLTGPVAFTDGIDRYLRQQGLSDVSKSTAHEVFTANHPLLTVLPLSFHTSQVVHLFTGSTPVTGWKAKVAGVVLQRPDDSQGRV